MSFSCSQLVTQTISSSWLQGPPARNCIFPGLLMGRCLWAKRWGHWLPGRKAHEAWEPLLGFPHVCPSRWCPSYPSGSSRTCGKACWGTLCGNCGEENGETLTLLSCVFTGPPSSFLLCIVVLIYSFFPFLPSLMDFQQDTFPPKKLFFSSSNCFAYVKSLLSSARFTSQKGHCGAINAIKSFLDKCWHLISPLCVNFLTSLFSHFMM